MKKTKGVVEQAQSGNVEGPSLLPEVFKCRLRLSDHPLVHLPEHSFSLCELHSVLSPIPVWNELSLVLGELTFQETKRNLQN